MERWQRNVGRISVALGLAAAIGWLVWRVGWSLAGAPRWAAAALLAVEVAGTAGTALLAWALWPGVVSRADPGTVGAVPAATTTTSALTTTTSAITQAATSAGVAVTVVVRSDDREVPWLEATLLALRAGVEPSPVLVLDLERRSDVAATARRHGATVVAPADPHDLNGWSTLLDECATPFVFVLDAGDIARPDAVTVLAEHLADDVAVVQGRVESALDDSAEHRRPGRHERDVDRFALGPALGRRGAALLTGAGALVRVAPVREIEPGNASMPMAEAALSAGLLAEGWRIVAPAGAPVAAVDPHLLAEDAERWRACEASAARALLVGPDGALRGRGLPWRARLALATWSIRPLAGLRRGAVVGLLAATLLSGRLPFTPSATAIAGLWLPSFLLTAAGLDLLSGHTLIPGERVRQGWHTLGTAWRGVLAPNGRPDDPRPVLGPAFGLEHGVAPSLAVAVLSIVLGLRGLSDRVTHTLEPIAGSAMAGLLVAALWTLWGALDALRVIARRSQSRRAARVGASLPCTLTCPDRDDTTSRHEVAGVVVDLTPLGAALVTEGDAEVGGRTDVTVVLPTASGCTTAHLVAEVRNGLVDWTGERRYGVRFVDPEPYIGEALAELCVIRPAREVLGFPAPTAAGEDVTAPVVPALGTPVPGPRRLALRAAALVAIAGTIGSARPARAAAAPIDELRATVDTALPAGTATAIVALGGLLAVAVLLGSLPDGLSPRRRPTSR
jgi:hypothetical protein